LRPGTPLLTDAGHTVRVDAIRRSEGAFTVFNLEVDGYHTYHVSELSVLVHNKAMPLRPIRTGKWGKGSYGSPEESLLEHFKKHGRQVGADDVDQYLRKAEGFAQNLRGAKKDPVEGATPGVTRYRKLGKYIDIDKDGNIISFGK
jgi:hypothetical protein